MAINKPTMGRNREKKIGDKDTGIETKLLSREGLLSAGFMPIRIEINPRSVKIIDWKAHTKKIPKNLAVALEKTAREWGANPAEWWISYKPIPVKSFISPIEGWDGKQWVTIFKKEG